MEKKYNVGPDGKVSSLRVGGVYVVYTGDPETGYSFAKILSIDEDGLWLKLYYDNFPDVPTKFDKTKLPNGARMVPLSVAGFFGWGGPDGVLRPILVTEEVVTKDELSQCVADYYNYPKCRE